MGQDLYELLAQMKKRPAMWLRSPTVYSLEAFLNGFACAQLPGPSAWPSLWLLHDWTAHKFNQSSSAGWAYILTKQCQGDEKAALNLFFQLFEEFKELRIVRLLEIQLDPAAYAFYWSDECQVRRHIGSDPTRLPPPDSICVIQLSDGLGYYVLYYEQRQRLVKDAWYASFRACLRGLRAEFGPTMVWQEGGSLATAAIIALF
jgi:hypothetical protein